MRGAKMVKGDEIMLAILQQINFDRKNDLPIIPNPIIAFN
jgi:hypothetical protein